MENKPSPAPLHQVVGRIIWHKYPVVRPSESQLHRGRAPAIDEDGFLVTALFHHGDAVCMDVPIVMWAECYPPNPRGLPPGVPATPQSENQSSPGRPEPSC